MTRYPQFPTVRAVLRRIRHAPGMTTSESRLVIWLRGTAFHVRDESGRPYAEILGDVTAARGFGLMPRTANGFTDSWAAANRRPTAPTDLYGDLATGEGLVYESGRRPWQAAAGEIAPVARQLLTDGRESGRTAPTSTRLGRACGEYRFSVEGEEDGVRYRSDVWWLVSPPYVLLRETRDSRSPGLSALTEVVDLTEDDVTPRDVRP